MQFKIRINLIVFLVCVYGTVYKKMTFYNKINTVQIFRINFENNKYFNKFYILK